MKRIFILLLFFILFFGFFSVKTYAQTPTAFVVPSIMPENSGNPIPGVNCGYEKQQCCFFKPINDRIGRPGIPLLDQIVDLLNGAAERFIFGPVFKPINQLAEQSSRPCMDGLEPTTPGDITNSSCKCRVQTQDSLKVLLTLCKGIKSPTEQIDCEACLTGKNLEKIVGVWTGMGCIYTNTSMFITKFLLGWGIGLAGAASLICIIFSAIQMQMSSGNPEKIKKTQEMLTSCIMGLILIIFSVFILRLIGITILRIPGFS